MTIQFIAETFILQIQFQLSFCPFLLGRTDVILFIDARAIARNAPGN